MSELRSYNIDRLQSNVINNFPLPIANNYFKILEYVEWEKKARQTIHVFEFTVRSLGLILISQYLLLDRDRVSDDRLNKLLREKLSKPSLGSWVEILFTAITAYKNHRDLLFMPELHNAYWDVNQQKPNKGIREPFDKLVTIRNQLAHELPPQNDAGWQKLFEESHSLLLQVFDFIHFIGEYELIFIMGQDDAGYQYRIYKGLEIKETAAPLPRVSEGTALGEGWFYLTKGKGKERKLLKLYPFLIALERDIDLALEGIQSDAALLDKFSSSRIYYLATVLWETFFRQDENLLADFFYNYEKSLGKKIKERQVSWMLLKEIAGEITSENMGMSREKYNPKLYLDREEVRKVYQDFLISDKTGLVITGKSGVGKTNFVMATIEMFQSESRTCAFAYNGARLPADSSINELLMRDLSTRFEISSQRMRGDENIWKIFSDVHEINEKRVIVFIDAINENPNASTVLRQVDLLIGSNPYPWLKFVITSRPEAWRVMNRRLRLAENKYYWRAGEEEMGVELREFNQADAGSLTTNINVFSRNEIILAYGKYQGVYGLTTDYADLSTETRQVLRDPLMLRLIAEIYKNGKIPTTLRADQTYGDFINALVASKRLFPEDVIFLRMDIIPRMASNLGNALSEDDILADKSLYEKIFNADVLSTGRQINQSYSNLVDAEILGASSETEPMNVTFKYERFFDYFMGAHYFKKYHNTLDAWVRYKELAENVRTHPFLWGAVKNALISELESGQEELVFNLACQPDQGLKEMAIAVMTEYGHDSSGRSLILRLTKRLMAVHQNRLGFWERLRIYLPGKFADRVDPVGRGAAITALEVSRRLRLAEVLEDAAMDSSQTIRVIAMRNIYHYWRADATAGYDLVERLAKQVMTKTGFPRVAVLEACLGVTMLIMRHYNPNNEQGREIGFRLLTMWRNIVQRVLFLSEKETTGRRVLRSAIRKFLVSTIVQFIISMQENYPPSRPSYLRDVSLFFKLDNKSKLRFDRLIGFYKAPEDISKIYNDLLESIPENDTLTSLLIWLIIISYGKQQTNKVLYIAERMAKVALEQPVVGINAFNLNIAIGHIGLSLPTINDDFYLRHERMVENYLNKTHGFVYTSYGSKHSNLSLGEHGMFRRIRRDPKDKNLFKHFLRSAVENADWAFLEQLLFDVTIQATAFNNLEGALDALESLFPITENEVYRLVANTLSKIRIHHPESVDEFLLNLDSKNDLYQHITRIESIEQPWHDLLQAPSGTILLRLLETPEIKNEMSFILAQATKEKNLTNYMIFAIKRIINKFVGISIFD